MELVVGASEATMKSILGKLGSILAQEYTLIRGVRGDIQYINDELASMQAFLRDHSSGAEVRDHRMKDWMKQIRDMAYDCEDCVDDFAHRLPNDSIRDARCCSWIVTVTFDVWTWWPRRQIASNIAELKVRAQLIAERRSRYGVENTSNRSGNSSGARATAYDDIAEHQVASRQIIGMKKPVGMESDMEKFEKWASQHRAAEETNSTDVHPKLSVLSIVGFGGVGKTTIATALYQKVKNEFECRASVTVSQNYDEDAVLRSILNQVKVKEEEVMPLDRGHEHPGSRTGNMNHRSGFEKVRHLMKGSNGSSDVKQNKIETMNNKQLIKALRDQLGKKRYLLLIDDIWSANTWQNIRKCLPENEQGSKIIITSRFHAVGAACAPTEIDCLHQIGFLGGADSKKLFVDESKSNKHSDTIQNQVPELWKICGGLPLAIVTMAGLVACNPTKPKDYWIEVGKSLFPEQVASLSSDEVPEPVKPLTLDGVTRILDCCYNDLPGDLKTCSLYVSIFPKGWRISRKCLTRRWIAEGYVSEKQGLTEEEVAETYFNQLLRRKLIRPVEHSSNGKVKAFQVHDMVLEYIVSKASEENFITVVGGHWMMPAPSNKVRRLSMQGSGSKHENATKGMNLSQVRSLTVFGSLTELPFHAFNNRIIQVLDLDGWKGLRDKHMIDICRMLVLKYLSLRRTDIKKIPSKIEKLKYLETLDIRETKVTELPKAIGKLKRISSILGGNKDPRKGLRLPQERGKVVRETEEKSKVARETEEKSKDTRINILPKQKPKDGMKGLRVLSGIEIASESTELESLHQMTGLKKLAIYTLKIAKDGQTFKDLKSSIEYLCSCGLQTLAINDENSDFINSLNDMSAPPRYLIGLELSGKLESAPNWITSLHTLNKLILSVTALGTDTLMLLRHLPALFSLTFSLSAKVNDADIQKTLDMKKSMYDGEIYVPDGGYKSLKLLRLFAPHVPKLGFSDDAMPALEMIEMRFDTFEGLFGIDTLQKLLRVHLRVKDQSDETTKLILDNLKNNTCYGHKVSVQHTAQA